MCIVGLPADADDRGATDVIKAAENKDRNEVWVECKVTRGFLFGGGGGGVNFLSLSKYYLSKPGSG